MDSFLQDDWRPAVAQYLAGREFATFGVVAREALGRSYGSMSAADWRHLFAAMRSCGWRSRKHAGVTTWAPAPAKGEPQLAPAQPQLNF